MAARPLDDSARHELYEWLDSIPLSRPKRFISRDFADAYLLAEVIAHYQPRMVELHNYPAALSLANKRANWETLQSKVLRKLRINLSRDDIEALINAMPNAIERLLLQVRPALERLAAQEQEAGHGARRERNHVPGEGHSSLARVPQPRPPVERGERIPTIQHAPSQPQREAFPLASPQERVRELYHQEGSAAARALEGAPMASSDEMDVYRPEEPAARQLSPERVPTDDEYERLQAKLQAADAERILLCQKIENLEKLLHMKDSRIAAMNAKIQNLTAKVQALEAQ